MQHFPELAAGGHRAHCCPLQRAFPMPVLSGLIRPIHTSRLCPGLSLPACPGLKPQGPLLQQRGSFWALCALHSGPRVGPAQGVSTQCPVGVDPGLTSLRLTPQPSHWTAQGWQMDCAHGPVDGRRLAAALG